MNIENVGRGTIEEETQMGGRMSQRVMVGSSMEGLSRPLGLETVSDGMDEQM